ncbi:MAG: YigZ family protein [Fibrobacterales bacterium]
MKPYSIIAHPTTIEQEIKKSRFIAHAHPVLSKEEALSFIGSIKERHKTATHNCWAYIAGNPQGSHLGMSDDGEPQGTAGRPMLSYLQNRKIGDIAVVVTRYSSGIKLGTGGLVRAYTGATQEVIESGSPTIKVDLSEFTCSYAYTFDEHIRRIIADFNAQVINADYSDRVVLTILTPSETLETLLSTITRETNGSALLDVNI